MVKTQTREHLNKLHEMYDNWVDQDAIMALADIEKDIERMSQLAPILDHPIILTIKERAIERFALALGKISDREISMKMTDEERAYTFATMEWAQFTLDMIGEQSPGMLERSIDERVAYYASTKLSTG